MIDWGAIITKILEVLIALAMPGFLAWLYSKAVAEWQDFQKNKPSLSWFLEDAARIAVQAAEQLGIAGVLTEKKAWAITYVQKYLDAHGLHDVDVALIEGAVEAAVLELFNKDKPAKVISASGSLKP